MYIHRFIHIPTVFHGAEVGPFDAASGGFGGRRPAILGVPTALSPGSSGAFGSIPRGKASPRIVTRPTQVLT
jgi:hypothetical protein